ncbi:DNA polymerase-3 subunit gamma/tau [Desulfatibacillum alkenivorans DSM 16219]|jgi:DNA polymerase-3 subunit gamma/tau|uniref:DNA polymerase III subunit gamma/tau n=1 Tax=Desulfatibacillum alkenivorans DSM 16219 TaxID=1121393 RepID=A0A1M6IEG3_9BACT|nr:DNA polymerase III subunit gamma/tau [Desulfatibacillum alkenivorans]SHJ32773.1 DNA polymerase-3 subunit gamma/tau [Desulfatibacillum alkenivorans DSM 16219]
MSYLVLARKYRPQTFDEVVAQPHITETLKNAINQERVAHALCLSGPRGTGKTTVARILAKAMNCVNGPTPEPCGVCASCKEIAASNAVDVFEIDGASNNSVEQVRELRENVQYAPALGNYKVYIIDEVHMLSQAAFNALLKTLEEPPPHVMFILATTESHKIPVTILSRCQRYDFKRISLDDIVGHLAKLAGLENFTIEEQSLWAVARRSGGCMRDALSLLDQVMAYSTGEASFEKVLDILGVAGRKSLFALAQALLNRDVPACLSAVDQLYARGYDLKQVMADLLDHLRDLTVVKTVRDPGPLLDIPPGEIQAMQEQVAKVSPSFVNQVLSLLFKEEAAVRLSPQPRLALEVALIRICEVTPAVAIDSLVAALEVLASQTASKDQIIHIGPASGPAPALPESSGESAPPAPEDATASAAEAAPQHEEAAPAIAPDPQPEPKPQQELAPEPKPEPEPEPQQELAPEPKPEPEPEPQQELAPDPKPEPEPEPQQELAPEPEPPAEPEKEVAPELEPPAKPEKEVAPEPDPEPQPPAEAPQAAPEAEAEAEVQAPVESASQEPEEESNPGQAADSDAYQADDESPYYPEPDPTYAAADSEPIIPDMEPDYDPPQYETREVQPEVMEEAATPEEPDAPAPEPEDDEPEPPPFEGDPWEAFSKDVKEKNIMLGLTLEKCRLKEYGEGRFVLETDGSPFSRDQLNLPEYQTILMGVCKSLFGRKVQLVIEEPSEEDRPAPAMNQAEKRRELEQEALNHPLVEEAVRIFGGKVVEIRQME